MRDGTEENEEVDDFDEHGLSEDSEEQDEQAALDDDIIEFEEYELAHNQAFDGVAQRISCFSHTLQLVVNKLIKHPTVAPVLDKVYKIVRKVSSSTVATPALITLTGNNQAFDGVAQRISCFSHTLQLVVNKLIKHPTVAPVLDKVYKIVRKVSSSTVATPALITLTGKKLVSHCQTRWSSTFLVISRLLEVKDALIKVLEDALIDGLFARVEDA